METIMENNGEEKYQKYVFIRLYSANYKTSLHSIALNILKMGISIKKKASDGKVYTHAAIGTTLNDEFYGLTTGGSKALKIEKCINNNPKQCPHMSDYDTSKSHFSVFAIPISDKDYETLKEVLKASSESNKMAYSIASTFKIGAHIKDEASKNIKTSEEYLVSTKKIDNIVKKLENESIVCSTFIASVLEKSVPKLRSHFASNKINVHYITPNGLTRLPGIKKIIDFQIFDDYNKSVEKLIESDQKFKYFYTKK